MAGKQQDTTDTNSGELVSVKTENLALKKELEALKAENLSLNSDLQGLLSKNSSMLERLKELQLANTTLDTELTNLQVESDAKTIVIATLEAELAKQAESLPKPQIATLGGKKYRPTMPAFNWKGTIYTSKDVLENETLLAQLVEMKSGAIEEIQTEE
ncbi:hypothetical protein [Runella limosa]|uniref:hypothetical protein n=1 Tax=Runella limosa TaxID=370978 RepID=UPI00041FB886|nr:hypothetical protein [Runella limosa]